MPNVGDTHSLYKPNAATWLTMRKPSWDRYRRVRLDANPVLVPLDEPGRWFFQWSTGATVPLDVGTAGTAQTAMPISGGPAYRPYTQDTGY